MTRRALAAITLTLLLSMAAHGEPIEPEVTYRYEARMAMINAGILSLELGRQQGIYEVLGQFNTSRAMNKYYSWNGLFAARGDWQNGRPQTKAYLTRSKSSDDGYKVVIYTPKETRRLRKASEVFETRDKPEGVDLITALFISPDCFQGSRVHDGEDDYEIQLLKRKIKTVNATPRYYSGPGIQCDYQVRDNKGRKRRIQIVLADINGKTVAAAASIKIPLLPDPAFRLLVSDSSDTESSEKSTPVPVAGL